MPYRLSAIYQRRISKSPASQKRYLPPGLFESFRHSVAQPPVTYPPRQGRPHCNDPMDTRIHLRQTRQSKYG